ncbi:hypothetical protein AMTRI_Chr01g105110 [Amborella trichopoda]
MAVVTPKDSVLVTPSEPTPSEVLALSTIDSQRFLRFTIEYILVYRDGDQELLHRMRAALGLALVPYYPLAGRLRERNRNHGGGGGLEVVCNAQGALFIEATSTFSLHEMLKTPKHCKQWRGFLPEIKENEFIRAPPLIVQATRLVHSRGLVVCVGFSHCLCDGIGSCQFLKYWADLTSGRPELQPQVWARHLLKHHWLPPSPRTMSPEFERVVDMCGLNARLDNKDRLVPSMVTFDRMHLDELKRSAGRGITAFEALAAHVWQSWVRALELPERQTVKLLFSVNVREKMVPPLPKGYWGNAFVLACAQSGAKDVREKGTAWAARAIRRAKERVGDEYVRSVVGVLGEEEGLRPDMGGVMVVSQWSRMGLEEVDFGKGLAVVVGAVCADVYCYFLPVVGRPGAVCVAVALPGDAVAKYDYYLRSPSLC